MVQIPTVVGVTITDATARIKAAAFPDPTVTEEWSDTAPKDEVMSCSPDQETLVRHDAAITLTVSKGPEPITIPSVIGSTLQTAQDTLKFYALNVIVQHGRTLDNVAVGQIYKQDPAPNAAGFRTQDMTIWVSDGKPQVQVPDFTFNSVTVAQQKCTDLGLTCKLQKKYPNSQPDNIVDQSIAPNTTVDVGTTLTLVYATNPF
jgi:serine/threonine-protein kinase